MWVWLCNCGTGTKIWKCWEHSLQFDDEFTRAILDGGVPPPPPPPPPLFLRSRSLFSTKTPVTHSTLERKYLRALTPTGKFTLICGTNEPGIWIIVTEPRHTQHGGYNGERVLLSNVKRLHTTAEDRSDLLLLVRERKIYESRVPFLYDSRMVRLENDIFLFFFFRHLHRSSFFTFLRRLKI